MLSKATKLMARVQCPEVDSQAEMKSEMKKEVIFEAQLIVVEDNSSSTTVVDLSDVNIHHFSTLKNCYELQYGFCIMPTNS